MNLVKNTKSLAAVSSLIIATSTAHAFTLDWSNVDYTDGSLSQTFTNVDGSGVDMTFDFTFSGGAASIAGTPHDQVWGGSQISTNYGESDAPLTFAFDPIDANQFMDLKITFSQAVSGVDFNIYDIDADDGSNGRGFYGDVLDITANAGTVFAGMSAGSGITAAGSTLTGGITSAQDPGQLGNTANIDFGTVSVSSIDIRYSSTADFADPTFQMAAVGNIDFSQVPEPTSAMLLLTGGALLGLRRRR